VLVGRDGAEIRRQPVAGWDVVGTSEGFLYATAVDTETALVHVDTRTGASSTFWLNEGEWRLLWAEQNQAEPTVSWAQLAEPLPDPPQIESDSTPTPLPDYPPFRSVGMPIQVYMPEDEYLNLRSAPSLASEVLALLEPGTRGTIIGGSIIAEGYTWWEIRVPGRTGWVVETVGDILALIPPQDLPPSIESTEESTEESTVSTEN